MFEPPAYAPAAGQAAKQARSRSRARFRQRARQRQRLAHGRRRGGAGHGTTRNRFEQRPCRGFAAAERLSGSVLLGQITHRQDGTVYLATLPGFSSMKRVSVSSKYRIFMA